MPRQEKNAWLNLAVIGLALTAFCVLIFIIGIKRATGAFGLLGLLGLIPMANRSRGRGQVEYDERDGMIQANAVQISYAIFWVLFVAGSMALFFLYEDRGALPVQILPLFPLVGWIVLTLVQSIATLIQYKRGR